MQELPLVESLHAWTTPLFITRYSGHDSDSEALLAQIYRQQAAFTEAVASGVAPVAKQALYESPLDFLQCQTPEIQNLTAFLQQLVLMVAEEVNLGCWPEHAKAEVNITESWFHITRTGGFHDVHSHPNCSWCGIYYLDVGDCDFSGRNGVNRFYDPRINAEHYLDAGSQYLNQEGVWDIEPVNGQLVIFPSYLKHSALTYMGGKDRVVIAFNAQVHFCE